MQCRQADLKPTYTHLQLWPSLEEHLQVSKHPQGRRNFPAHAAARGTIQDSPSFIYRGNSSRRRFFSPPRRSHPSRPLLSGAPPSRVCQCMLCLLDGGASNA